MQFSGARMLQGAYANNPFSGITPIHKKNNIALRGKTCIPSLKCFTKRLAFPAKCQFYAGFGTTCQVLHHVARRPRPDEIFPCKQKVSVAASSFRCHLQPAGCTGRSMHRLHRGQNGQPAPMHGAKRLRDVAQTLHQGHNGHALLRNRITPARLAEPLQPFASLPDSPPAAGTKTGVA